jgi:hypothetical protein
MLGDRLRLRFLFYRPATGRTSDRHFNLAQFSCLLCRTNRAADHWFHVGADPARYRAPVFARNSAVLFPVLLQFLPNQSLSVIGLHKAREVK